MEMTAGLRWESGRERMRLRRRVPSVKAVEAVKEGKTRVESERSWARRVLYWCSDEYYQFEVGGQVGGIQVLTSLEGSARGCGEAIGDEWLVS